MKTWKRRTVSAVILPVLAAVLIAGAAAALPLGRSGAYAAVYRPESGWKDSTDEDVAAGQDGSVSLVGQSYYANNLFDEEYFGKTGKMRITVEFTLVGRPKNADQDNRFGFFLRDRPIESNSQIGGAGAAGSTYKGAFFPTYPCMPERNVGEDEIGGIGADYFYFFNLTTKVDYNLRQTVQFEITDKTFDVFLNGIRLGACREESTGLAANLESMRDEEGKLNAYFAIMNIHGPGDDDFAFLIHDVYTDGTKSEPQEGEEIRNFGPEDEWRGSVTAVEEGEESDITLTNGSVYSNVFSDISQGVQCEFEILSVSAYPTASSGFTAYFKDSKVAGNTGNGFRFNLKPVSRTGDERTQLSVGYLSAGTYVPLLTGRFPVDAVGRHYIALGNTGGAWKAVFDGYAAYFDKDDFGVRDMTAAMDAEKIRAVFLADNFDPLLQREEGDFSVRIQGPAVPDRNFEGMSAGTGTVRTVGELRTETLESGGRVYSVVRENKTFLVDESHRPDPSGTVIFDGTPLRVFPNLKRQLEIRLKPERIPAYIGDGVGDAYVELAFSGAFGGTTDPAFLHRFSVTLRWKDENTLLASCTMGIASGEYETKVVPGEEIVILFGWDDQPSATAKSVISVNGTAALEGTLKKANFLMSEGEQGFFSVRTFNDSDSAVNWKFAVTSPVHADLTMPALEEGIPDETSPENRSVAPLFIWGGTGLAAGAAIFSGLFLLSKRGRNRENETKPQA